MIASLHPERCNAARGAAAAVLAGSLLSGCVAAALPVLAAGGLVTTRAGDRPASSKPQVVLPAEQRSAIPVAPAGVVSADSPAAMAAVPSATVREVAFADGSTVTIINSLPLGRDPAAATAFGPQARAAPPPNAGAGAGVVPVRGVRLTELRDLPPPSGAPLGFAANEGQAAFAAFAARQAAIPVIGGERRSAILADPTSMEPETRGCSIHPAAVLIDIDPAGGTIDLSRTLAGDHLLTARLAALRAEGVTIGWTTSRTADQAGAIRKALVASGLDPAGRDELVLLRFPEERKQTRRDEFAKAHCVVAIAGDERADFHELFDYLRNPAAAQPLEKLIGAGWFLVPPPLTPNQGPTD